MSDNKQPILNVETELPPMIHNEAPPIAGSAAPSDDVVMPAIVTTNGQKKKFAGGKFIATILGLFLLIGGIGAGVYLVGQNQNIKEKAWIPKEADLTNNSSYIGDNPDAVKTNKNSKKELDNEESSSSQTTTSQTVKDTGGGIYNCGSGSAPECVGKKNGENSGGGKTCKIREDGKTCSSVKDEALADATSTAQCQNVKAYSGANFVLLTPESISMIKQGDPLHFCVTGSASSGSFDKARFTINGVAQSETTLIRPGSTDFCQSYTVPAGVTTFNVTAQIHHLTLGWK